jgi:hypothetical protein
MRWTEPSRVTETNARSMDLERDEQRRAPLVHEGTRPEEQVKVIDVEYIHTTTRVPFGDLDCSVPSHGDEGEQNEDIGDNVRVGEVLNVAYPGQRRVEKDLNEDERLKRKVQPTLPQ